MSKETRRVTVATLEELYSVPYRNHIKAEVARTGFSQRDWPTKIQDALLYADRHNIGLYERFPIPLVDDVWNDNERYMREFMASEECLYPERDRLIDLYFRLMMQDHFGR